MQASLLTFATDKQLTWGSRGACAGKVLEICSSRSSWPWLLPVCRN
jgi:hypothetical protein